MDRVDAESDTRRSEVRKPEPDRNCPGVGTWSGRRGSNPRPSAWEEGWSSRSQQGNSRDLAGDAQGSERKFGRRSVFSGRRLASAGSVSAPLRLAVRSGPVRTGIVRDDLIAGGERDMAERGLLAPLRRAVAPDQVGQCWRGGSSVDYPTHGRSASRTSQVASRGARVRGPTEVSNGRRSWRCRPCQGAARGLSVDHLLRREDARASPRRLTPDIPCWAGHPEFEYSGSWSRLPIPPTSPFANACASRGNDWPCRKKRSRGSCGGPSPMSRRVSWASAAWTRSSSPRSRIATGRR